MSQRSNKLAKQLEAAVTEFGKTVEGCSDAQWAAVCNAEGWTVAQTAQHVSGQFVNEMMFITAGAEGRPLPGITLDQLNTMNDARAVENSSVTKTEVLGRTPHRRRHGRSLHPDPHRPAARSHGAARNGRRRNGQHTAAD